MRGRVVSGVDHFVFEPFVSNQQRLCSPAKPRERSRNGARFWVYGVVMRQEFVQCCFSRLGAGFSSAFDKVNSANLRSVVPGGIWTDERHSQRCARNGDSDAKRFGGLIDVSTQLAGPLFTRLERPLEEEKVAIVGQS
jgi:hypothetical protein